MKECYYSDVLDRYFDSREECLQAEAKHAEAQELAKKRVKERDTRQKEVDEAFERANTLQREYIKDYGLDYYRVINPMSIFDLFHSL
jgi:hypothetical protein